MAKTAWPEQHKWFSGNGLYTAKKRTYDNAAPNVTGDCHNEYKAVCHELPYHAWLLAKRDILLSWIDVAYYKLLFSTTLNINDLIEADDKEFYLLFLKDAFAYMDKYHYEESMKKVVAEIENLLNNSIIGTASDNALLLDYKAAMEDQTSKAIKLKQQAFELQTGINADNALLVSNLNANMDFAVI